LAGLIAVSPAAAPPLSVLFPVPCSREGLFDRPHVMLLTCKVACSAPAIFFFFFLDSDIGDEPRLPAVFFIRSCSGPPSFATSHLSLYLLPPVRYLTSRRDRFARSLPFRHCPFHLLDFLHLLSLCRSPRSRPRSAGDGAPPLSSQGFHHDPPTC